ncbi:hypothetical protein CGL51_13460 [Pyrobaculum aerophilum]|uniref:Uncharacterized protein n=1 Tax=Pyrobaculum aerophilum TaxID=13773 RepID=A0A371R517_9CREN|nr:hypothetical protein CGL51_13460 [Pyrobaculum aerophilum]RFA99176.1 hypothetical protein CGL52_04885 [Pyrobaculum aerophilum]
MSNAERCPCVAQFLLTDHKERLFCRKLIRISTLELLDYNELGRYLDVVGDDELYGCNGSTQSNQVDCIARCDSIVGVEFTTWAEARPLEDKFNKNVGESRCGRDVSCVVVIGVHGERVPFLRDKLGKELGVEPETLEENQLGQLKDYICSRKPVLVLSLRGRGYLECTSRSSS